MKTHSISFFETLRASFWFKPSFMAVGAMLLAFITVKLDREITQDELHSLSWIYNGGAEGASAVLQTIANSMIAIAGVVFSLTLVARSLASSQFGSRVLRSFMRDGTNQIVLGTFIATFLYCLLVLRTIRRGEEGLFVPHVSATLEAMFAIASLWMLIYFIHHLAMSIQADKIIARVAVDLDKTTNRLFPEEPASNGSTSTSVPLSGELQVGFERNAGVISAGHEGYLQLVDLEQLVKLASEADLIFRLERRHGITLSAAAF